MQLKLRRMFSKSTSLSLLGGGGARTTPYNIQFFYFFKLKFFIVKRKKNSTGFVGYVLSARRIWWVFFFFFLLECVSSQLFAHKGWDYIIRKREIPSFLHGRPITIPLFCTKHRQGTSFWCRNQPTMHTGICIMFSRANETYHGSSSFCLISFELDMRLQWREARVTFQMGNDKNKNKKLRETCQLCRFASLWSFPSLEET